MLRLLLIVCVAAVSSSPAVPSSRRAIVRIRTLQSDFGSESQHPWMLSAKPGALPSPANGLCSSPQSACTGFTATEVPQMVDDLHPTQLERFVSGPQNLSVRVPVSKGEPEMTVLEFLNACQDRLAPGGEITVRASLNTFWRLGTSTPRPHPWTWLPCNPPSILGSCQRSQTGPQ